LLAVFLFYQGTHLYEKSLPTEFIYLNKNSGSTRDCFSETILLRNPPQNFNKLVMEYFRKNRKICLLDSTYNYYTFTIYEKSRCSSYFIEHAEDPGGFSSYALDQDCGQNHLVSWYFKRNKKKKKEWVPMHEYGQLKGIDYSNLYCNNPIPSDVQLLERPYNE